MSGLILHACEFSADFRDLCGEQTICYTARTRLSVLRHQIKNLGMIPVDLLLCTQHNNHNETQRGEMMTSDPSGVTGHDQLSKWRRPCFLISPLILIFPDEI